MSELMDCEACWTHSIPLNECDGLDRCPHCGSDALTEQGDDFDAAVWGGGHNRAHGSVRGVAGMRPTNRPTPETDAEATTDYAGIPMVRATVDADFSRTLERQRDEAREKLAELTDCGQDGSCVLSPGCIRHWEERCRELVRERDEARDKLKFIDVQGRERSHDKRWAFRLRRMVRLALRWREQAKVARTRIRWFESGGGVTMCTRIHQLTSQLEEMCRHARGWTERADRAEAELANMTADRDSWRSQCNDRADNVLRQADRADRAEAELAKVRAELDWQNMPNRREPTRGGYEFYVNEEWTGIRDAALGEDAGFHATLMKTRYDPDDERVRVRRVLDDDAILRDLATEREGRAERDAALNIAEDMRRERDKAHDVLNQINHHCVAAFPTCSGMALCDVVGTGFNQLTSERARADRAESELAKVRAELSERKDGGR